MNLFEALVLGVIQGLTEFLPVSSSGHLILAEKLMHLNVEAMKSFDIALHAGTLLAILIYFRKDFIHLIYGLISFFTGRKDPEGKSEIRQSRTMIKYLIIGTIPAVIAGLFFGDFLDENFRNPVSVAIMMIIVGAFFFFAEYVAGRIKRAGLDLKNTTLIGVAQSLALLPGISRSGSTISAGLVQGIKRDEAARFSFLLGSVAITAASALSVYKIMKGEFAMPQIDILATGVVSSFFSGYVAVAFLMSYLRRHKLHIFGVYRIILGLAMLYFMANI